MARVILSTGNLDALAAALAARYRVVSDRAVSVQTPDELVADAAGRSSATRPVDEVWWLGRERSNRRVGLREVLTLLPALNVRSFHVVGPLPKERVVELERLCAMSQIHCSIINLPCLLDAKQSGASAPHGALMRFLEVVDAIVAELDRRCPGYFRTQPLRYLAPADATIDIASIQDVADALWSIGQSVIQPPRQSSHHYRIIGESPIQFAELCVEIGRIWNIDLQAVSDERALNAVDRYMQRRLLDIDIFDNCSKDLAHVPSRATAYRVSTADARSQSKTLSAFHRQRLELRKTVRARVAAMPAELSTRSVANIPGLTYQVAGQTTDRDDQTLVLLNALGQNLTVWMPLLERLSRKRRIIACTARQTDSNGRPLGFAEHCADVHAILTQESPRACHLIGWCTGAKLATRYCHSHPGTVRSAVFLSGSFKHPGRAPDFDTAYERNLESMCQAVARQPAMAARLRSLFAAAGGGDKERALDDEESALQALTGVPAGLASEVAKPFRDVATLVVYAQQHVDFWSYDETAAASAVQIPILGVVGQYDRIVSPAAFRAGLSHFPFARYMEIEGATHYSFYERPGRVAQVIEDFLTTLSH